MTPRDLAQLAVLTVRDPAQAAHAVIGMELNRDTLWSGLVLTAALNAILFALSDLMLPTPPIFPTLLHQPLVYFAVVVLGFVVFIQSMAWAGRALGGKGGFDDLLPVMVWFQALRVAVQAVSLVLMLAAPFLSLLLAAAAGLVGIWVLLHFLSEALRLGSIGRAAAVLILASLVVVVAASFLIALVGGPILGSVENV